MFFLSLFPLMCSAGSSPPLPAHEEAIWIHNKAAQMLLSFSASVFLFLHFMNVLIRHLLSFSTRVYVWTRLMTSVGWTLAEKARCVLFIFWYSVVHLVLGRCHTESAKGGWQITCSDTMLFDRPARGIEFKSYWLPMLPSSPPQNVSQNVFFLETYTFCPTSRQMAITVIAIIIDLGLILKTYSICFPLQYWYKIKTIFSNKITTFEIVSERFSSTYYGQQTMRIKQW